MKKMFTPDIDGSPGGGVAVDKATGWSGLSGRSKILLAGASVAAIMAAVVVPGITSKRVVQTPATNDSHSASGIKTYTPPPAPDVATRMTGATASAAPAPVMVRRVPSPTEMELYAPTLGSNAGSASNGGASSGDGAAGAGGVSGAQQASYQEGGQGGTQMDGSGTSDATLVRHPSYVIRAGAIISCLPIPAIDSSRPGYTTCRVPEWFRSSDERRGLLPPGTLIFGHIASGITDGQRRLGVVYTKIETPEFNLQLHAPGADEMGRAGLDGDVHTFFWQKAGAVAVYALMDAAVGVGQNLATSALSNTFAGGGTTLNFGNQSESLASQEMQHTLNRPPILTRDQALPMTVTVGQDLDFSKACQLAMTVNLMACPLQ